MRPAILLTGFIAALGCFGLLEAPATAQPFPAKLVKFVVPQTPGGATDVFARKIGQILSERWGQPVVIENRAGAGGVVGTDVVAKSSPDGYTLLVTYAGSQAINASLYPKIPFDTIKDFQTVATLAVTPFILIVHPKLPAKDLEEFIALARAKPGALTYASSGNGSVNHLLGEMLKADTGISILHVPYRGVAPAITDVMGGQVDAAFSSVPSVLQMVRGGNVRAIAVSSARRIAIAPEIPTMAESGLPGFDVNPWWGILAPAGTDMAIVRKINSDVASILRTPEMIDFLAAQGAEPLITSPEEFLGILQADVVKWAKVVKDADVTIN
ncbi:MAG TPA: tripartite tricarboxylate transporter substrate binding protein [Bradyrhizobium sp.]|nr:tripartite tricarboxylate transporter substrate binding protein [Bradyrhizobium sp.]